MYEHTQVLLAKSQLLNPWATTSKFIKPAISMYADHHQLILLVPSQEALCVLQAGLAVLWASAGPPSTQL
jgi:hypothetical protein